MKRAHRFQRSRSSGLAALLVALVVGAMGAGADSLDRAREHFNAGRYAEAYESLAYELESVRPDPQALIMALDALLSDGRIVKASEIARHWIEGIYEAGKPAVEASSRAFYHAGRIAEIKDDRRLAVSRYRQFVTPGGVKDDETRHALIYLLKHEPQVAEYKRYTSLFGRSPDGRYMGLHVAQQLMRRRFGNFVSFTEYLLQLYPTTLDAVRIIPGLQAGLNQLNLSADHSAALDALHARVIARAVGRRIDLQELYDGLSKWMSPSTRFELLCRVFEADTSEPLRDLTAFVELMMAMGPTERASASKRLLSYESRYRRGADAALHYAYLKTILSNPSLFSVETGLSDSTATDWVQVLYGRKNGFLPQRADLISLLVAGRAQPSRLPVLQGFLRYADHSAFADALDLFADSEIEAIGRDLRQSHPRISPVAVLMAKMRKQTNAGAYEESIATARKIVQQLAQGRSGYGYREMVQSFFASEIAGAEQRADVLASAAGVGEYPYGLAKLILSIEQPVGLPEGAHEQLKALRGIARYTELRTQCHAAWSNSEDPLRSAFWDVHSTYPDHRHTNGPVNHAIHKLARDVLTKVDGAVPGSATASTNVQQAMLREICVRHSAHVTGDEPGLKEWGAIWVNRLEPGLLFDLAVMWAHRSGMDVGARYADALEKGAQPNPELFWELAGIAELGIGYPKFVPISSSALRDPATYIPILRKRPQWRLNGGPEYFTDLMWKYAMSGERHENEYDRIKSIAKCQWQYFRAGHTAKVREVSEMFLRQVEREPVHRQINSINLFIDNSREATDEFTLQKLPGLYDRLTEIGRSRATVFSFVQQNLDYWQKDPQTPGGQRKVARDLEHAIAGQLVIGLGSKAEVQITQDRLEPSKAWLRRQIKRADWPEVVTRLLPYADIALFDGLPGAPAKRRQQVRLRFDQHAVPVLKDLQEAGADELAYVFLSAVGRRSKGMPHLGKLVNEHLARVAIGLDIIPVHQNDPLYPLHKAASEMKRGNAGRAWELTFRQLELLRTNWRELNRRYVVWVVEQFGKRKMLDEGIKLASDMLIEDGLDPEIAAEVSLLRGDLYRDSRNYDAARIEYQALRDNPVYKNVDARRLASYRLVELMIDTRAYANAEPLLDRLLDSRHIGDRAEASYLKGRIAFEEEDYESCKEWLDKAMALNPAHAETLLLDGRLRLHRERGLEEIEIRIGEKQLRTVIIPGRPLRLTLLDQSLNVVRQGNEVPVIIVTEPGGDKERLVLYPATSNKRSFEGILPTAMGAVKPGNARIELFGLDRIGYHVDPAYQARFGLDYPIKYLEVKSSARLAASSGIILGEEELRRIRMEERLRRSDRTPPRSDPRAARTVRPGNPIYVHVTDADRNISDQMDSVLVSLETSSGDRLRASLGETEPYGGGFRGEIQTGIPFARAVASDTAEGNDPNAVISRTRAGVWRSESDGVKPKWFMIDTMSSYEIGSSSITLSDSTKPKRILLEASISGDPVPIGEYPPSKIVGGLWLQVSAGSALKTARGVRERVGDTPPILDKPSYTPKRDIVQKRLKSPAIAVEDLTIANYEGPLAVRLSGTFHNPEIIKGAILCSGIESNAFVELSIDGELVYSKGSNWRRALRRSIAAYIEPGIHSLELVSSLPQAPAQAIQVERVESAGTALPEEWFSPAGSVELREALTPNAAISVEGHTVMAELRQPERYRKLRWSFADFTGLDIGVDAVDIRDATNGIVVPVEQDFTMGLKNEILEIAPGDTITVTYFDERRLTRNEPVLSTTLNAAYANGTIALAVEIASESDGGERELRYHSVQRCRRGDTLLVVIRDIDEDVSPAADKLMVFVETSGAEQLTLEAIEHRSTNPNEEQTGVHGGVFQALLRLGETTGDHTIRIGSAETLQVSYLDRENLNPGVPVLRSASITEAGSSRPQLFIMPKNIVMTRDTGVDAMARIERLRRKPYNQGRTNLQIWTSRTIDWHAERRGEASQAVDPEELAAQRLADLITSDSYLTSLDAPLRIRVLHPAAALHAASRFKHVRVVTQSELDLAKSDGREPRVRNLNLPLSDIGSGLFATTLQLQLGAMQASGEGADESAMGNAMAGPRSGPAAATQSTLMLAPDDVIHLSIENEDGEEIAHKTVRLASDAFLELMERSFSARSDTLHLGESFYIRVRDRDMDRSDQRDMVHVTAVGDSGGSADIALNETFARSGMFEGFVTTSLRRDPDASGAGAVTQGEAVPLALLPGDMVQFVYKDQQHLHGDAMRPVHAYGQMKFGADGGIAAFSRRFQDAEMAVKTSFLMAEALFEMAKDQRGLGNTEAADSLIERGRDVLEEALRDFPDTTLIVRGEFLLANLAEELGRYGEALRRYATVVSAWPDSEYAPRALFKKALTLEKQGDSDTALEEYVRLTYIYKDHPLAADAVVRLASYYYKLKEYTTSAEIFTKFQKHNPEHRLAAKALALAGLSHMKDENYAQAMRVFEVVVRDYIDNKDVRAESMYWLGDAALNGREYAEAYRAFKQLTWDYPDSKWAKMARGRLTENVLIGTGDNE